MTNKPCLQAIENELWKDGDVYIADHIDDYQKYNIRSAIRYLVTKNYDIETIYADKPVKNGTRKPIVGWRLNYKPPIRLRAKHHKQPPSEVQSD